MHKDNYQKIIDQIEGTAAKLVVVSKPEVLTKLDLFTTKDNGCLVKIEYLN